MGRRPSALPSRQDAWGRRRGELVSDLGCFVPWGEEAKDGADAAVEGWEARKRRNIGRRAGSGVMEAALLYH